MQKKTQSEIIDEIKKTENVTAVEIIVSDEDASIPNRPLLSPIKASVIINDKMFSIGYEIEEGYTFDFLRTLKKEVLDDDVLLIWFKDAELPEAWRQAYEKVGILENNQNDRRLQFHQYNDMNEMFCIDRILLWDITDEFKGTEHELTEETGFYRWHITKWYKNHLI